MKIYFAGGVRIDTERRSIKLYENRLISYFYLSLDSTDYAVFKKIIIERIKE